MKELYAPEGFPNFATFSSPVSYFFFLFRSIHVTVGRKRSGEWNERQTLGWQQFRSVEAESIDWSRHSTVPSIPVRRLRTVYECRLKLRNQNRRRNRRCKFMEELIVRDRGLRTCVFPIVSSREKPTENGEQQRRHRRQACVSWRGFQLTNVYTYNVRRWDAYCARVKCEQTVGCRTSESLPWQKAPIRLRGSAVYRKSDDRLCESHE